MRFDGAITNLTGSTVHDICTKEKNLHKQVIRVGIWNAKIMFEGQCAIVTKKLERYKREICGISELRWNGKGHFMMLDGWMDMQCTTHDPRK